MIYLFYYVWLILYCMYWGGNNVLMNSLWWMQYFVEANAIALRRVSKEAMRHIAKATGATQVHIS